MEIRHILTLTDLSESSVSGLALANSLARRFHAQVHAGHVFTPTPLTGRLDGPTPRDAEHVLEWYRNDQRNHLEALLKKHIDPLRLAGIETVESTSAREGIGTLVARTSPDLICMATHGRTGLQHVLLGSVAEQTIRTAGVPVLVTKGAPFADSREPLRVLVGLDLLEEPDQVVSQIAPLFTAEDALLLAHVVESAYLSLAPYGEHHEEHLPDARNLMEAAETRLRGIELGAGSPRISVHVSAGKAGPGLVQLESELKSHLVVAHTHSRRGFDRLMLGSVAEYLARRCKGAVLVLPKQG